MRLPGATHRNVYVSSEAAAKRVLAGIGDWIERHLRLRVNRAKSGAGRPWERKFLGFRLNSPRAARSSTAKCCTIQAEGARDLAQLPQCHESGVTRRVAAVCGGLVGILPAGPGTPECLSAGRLDTATQAEVLLAALARSARPPESVTAAGGGRAADRVGANASRGMVHVEQRVVAQGSVERHSQALRVGGAIESCGVRVRSPGPTAGYGKPYVRWCGRVPGRNPRYPTRSSWANFAALTCATLRAFAVPCSSPSSSTPPC